MKVIPALDLRGELVVRGAAGRRQEYRPIVSRLATSARPTDVAGAFRDQFGLSEIYLADLDAIAGAAPALPVYAELIRLGFQVLVDAGIRDVADAAPLADLGVHGAVAGLETLNGPEALDRLHQRLGDAVVFSLDLKGGRPLGNLSAWNGSDPWAIARRALGCGVRRIIVLDLARVGLHSGTGTEELCCRLAGAFPDVCVMAGGGIRGEEDLSRLHESGVKAALVASALHDGRLTRGDLSRVSRQECCP
jgi:phosphoribosylformimino-5-aminoimidazole carboxamide ribotide isomerase